MRLRKPKNFNTRLEKTKEYFLTEPIPAARENSLFLEIGCGRGAFIHTLAERLPEADFIAVEKDAYALLRAMERCAAEPRPNLRFLSCDGGELLEWLPKGGVSGIYLNFSDPWPHWKHAYKRLTHKGFLALYRTLLTPGGFIRMKTDDEALFQFSCKELTSFGFRVRPLAAGGADDIPTEYELRFRAEGRTVFGLWAVPDNQGTE